MFDVAVLGGGAGGCVVAARLVAAGARVCLVEAGPDHGPHAAGRWPSELLDARGIPETHQWDPAESHFTPLRARTLGGCSTHNACLLMRGHPGDFAVWPEGWSWSEMERCTTRAEATMGPLWRFPPEAWSPWLAAVVAAGSDLGMPAVADVADPATTAGFGFGPFNIRGTTRWNAAFAYVDPVREHPGLSIAAGTLVDRFEIRAGRAVAAVVHSHAGESQVTADRYVLSSGAFGSPAILLRSGVGPAAGHDLPGVGANLADHPVARVEVDPGDDLRRRIRDQAARGELFFGQGIGLARSPRCPQRTWDLLILPVTTPAGETAHLTVVVLDSRSRGQVTLRSADPRVSPAIDHAFLTDPAGHDEALLRGGMDLAFRLGEGAGASPAGAVTHDDRIRTTLRSLFHPLGTCRIGPADDPATVVAPDGRVRGLDNVYVADASLIPAPPRGGPHLVTLAVGERIAELMTP